MQVEHEHKNFFNKFYFIDDILYLRINNDAKYNALELETGVFNNIDEAKFNWHTQKNIEIIIQYPIINKIPLSMFNGGDCFLQNGELWMVTQKQYNDKIRCINLLDSPRAIYVNKNVTKDFIEVKIIIKRG